MINLDTHILVFALNGDLTDRERRILAANTWSISAIVPWELAKLAQLDRIEVDLEDAEVTRAQLTEADPGRLVSELFPASREQTET